MFYINNYIDKNKFPQLSVFNWIEKDIYNIDMIFYKLKSALTKVTNLKKKEAKKKQKVVDS